MVKVIGKPIHVPDVGVATIVAVKAVAPGF